MTTPLVHRYADVPDPHDLALSPDSGDEHPLLSVMAGGVVGVLSRNVRHHADGRVEITYVAALDGIPRADDYASAADIAEHLSNVAAVAAHLAKELNTT